MAIHSALAANNNAGRVPRRWALPTFAVSAWRRRLLSPRLIAVLAAVGLAVGACGASGPDAPAYTDLAQACTADFCVSYPAGWELTDSGDGFMSFSHPAGDGILATVGRVNLEGVATNSGLTWPAQTEDVVSGLWSLFDGGGAELERVELVDIGEYDSSGAISTGRLWHRLIEVSASRGFGVEVRAPNPSWGAHAEAFRAGFALVDTES